MAANEKTDDKRNDKRGSVHKAEMRAKRQT
jgi:hypothetical protein